MLDFLTDSNLFISIGVILTFIVGIISLGVSIYSARQGNYIDTVSQKRVEWIYKFREYYSELVELVHSNEYKQYVSDSKLMSDHFDNLNKLVTKIELHLNFKGQIDHKIIVLVKKIALFENIKYFYRTYSEYIDDYESIKKDDYKLIRDLDEDEIVYDEEIKDLIERHKEMKEFIAKNSIMSKYVSQNYLEGEKLDELDNKSWLEYSEFYINIIGLGIDIDKKLDDAFEKLLREIKVYLKFEWNRVKFEARGKSYSIKRQKKDLLKLYNDYDMIMNVKLKAE